MGCSESRDDKGMINDFEKMDLNNPNDEEGS